VGDGFLSPEWVSSMKSNSGTVASQMGIVRNFVQGLDKFSKYSSCQEVDKFRVGQGLRMTD